MALAAGSSGANTCEEPAASAVPLICVIVLVPRLCLGMSCLRGSASAAGGAGIAVRYQAEPGNESEEPAASALPFTCVIPLLRIATRSKPLAIIDFELHNGSRYNLLVLMCDSRR